MTADTTRSRIAADQLVLGDYIAFGLLLWGGVGSVIIGASGLVYGVLAALPLLALRPLALRPALADTFDTRGPRPRIGPVVFLICVIYAVDAVVNARYRSSLFFPGAVEAFIEDANESVGQGRGAWQLLVAMMAFLPFLALDLFKRRYRRLPLFAVLLIFVLIVYEAGISRGFLMLGIVGSIAAYSTRTGRLFAAALLAFIAFNVASYFRGDFAVTQFALPIFDGVIFPYYNLALAIDNSCPAYGSWEYIAEFFKKFLPGFVFDKEVLSFNIILTRCLYPSATDEVESISVFTYLAEVVFFQPSVLTCLLIGAVLGVLSLACERLIGKWQLRALRVFAGLLMVFALRSRSLDVASFLIFLLVLLISFDVLASSLNSFGKTRTRLATRRTIGMR